MLTSLYLYFLSCTIIKNLNLIRGVFSGGHRGHVPPSPPIIFSSMSLPSVTEIDEKHELNIPPYHFSVIQFRKQKMLTDYCCFYSLYNCLQLRQFFVLKYFLHSNMISFFLLFMTMVGKYCINYVCCFCNKSLQTSQTL